MCNLSDNIWDEALAAGIAEGEARGEVNIILQMNRKGLTSKRIAEMLDREERD